MTKIVVPEGMLEAAWEKVKPFSDMDYGYDRDTLKESLKSAIRWLSENPIVPTEDQAATVIQETARIQYADRSTPSARPSDHTLRVQIAFLTEWQRRMFLAPVPEVLEEIKDLLRGLNDDDNNRDAVNEDIIEAYRRGRASK